MRLRKMKIIKEKINYKCSDDADKKKNLRSSFKSESSACILSESGFIELKNLQNEKND
jgi:hypothetical protein